MNLFVGNVSFDTHEDTIRAMFEAHGQVSSVRLMTDRETGRPRGFGFVEMPNDQEARAAMAALEGKDCDGRPLRVNEARPREDRGGFAGAPRRPGGGRSNRW